MRPRAPIEQRLERSLRTLSADLKSRLAELVELSWRMRSLQKATRILDCGIYRTATGLDVRAGYGLEDLFQSELFTEIEAARDYAEGLRQTVIAKGGFEELPPLGPVA